MPAPVVKCGLIGPNLTAIVAYLKGVCHASFSTIRKFLRDVIRVTVSRGQLAKLKVGRNAPMRRDAQNLAERFRKHGDAYFQFITTPGLEPTNNLAEQAIRFVVIDRRITQDTRSVTGRQWNERIWTMIATLTQQGRSILAYLRDALHSNLNNWPAPALPPAGP